ncbi:MAG TPA: hypothetical protein ENK05_11670 [Gammaproteobacteria bacterium]|nr:hypothetical protein [Gammaproteobacteria bacterium]
MKPPRNYDVLARAYRAVPGLADRVTLDQAMEYEALRRCLARVAEAQQRGPRRRPWRKYFTS